MSSAVLTKQYILDAKGKPIGVILPIEEYNALARKAKPLNQDDSSSQSPLYGALRYLGGAVAPTEVLDETRRELWSAWDNKDN